MIIVWGPTVRISPSFHRQDLAGITVALGSFHGRAIAVELVGRLTICISRLATVDECLIGEFGTFLPPRDGRRCRIGSSEPESP
jgi:hypothetical protein